MITKKKIQNLIVGLLTTLLFSCFVWISDSIQEITLPSSSEPTLLYSTQIQDNLQRTYLKAINEAKHSILFLIFSITDNSIIEALKQKSLEGVNVSIICDAKYSPYIDKKLGNKVHVIKRYGKGLMHLKVLVVDDEQTWIGSANMTGESLHMHGNLVLALNSPEMAEMVKKKAACLDEYSNSDYIPHQNFNIGNQQIELWFLPDDTQGINRIKDLIRSADKSIRVAMFTWTRFDFAKEIILAQKRDVNVEVVIDRASSTGSSAKVVKYLKDNGIKVRCNQGPELLHHKFIYIDEKTLESGSANWTKAAFNTNEDCFLIIHDLNQKQILQMNTLWQSILVNSK